MRFLQRKRRAYKYCTARRGAGQWTQEEYTKNILGKMTIFERNTWWEGTVKTVPYTQCKAATAATAGG
jgi:hypothetical protein